MVRGEGPRIERAQSQPFLRPVDRTLRFATPTTDDATEDVGKCARWTDRERRLECRERCGAVVRVHSQGEAGERQRQRVVLTIEDCRSGMTNRRIAIRLLETG